MARAGDNIVNGDQDDDRLSEPLGAEYNDGADGSDTIDGQSGGDIANGLDTVVGDLADIVFSDPEEFLICPDPASHAPVAGFSSSKFEVAGFVRIQTASSKRLNSHESSYNRSRSFTNGHVARHVVSRRLS